MVFIQHYRSAHFFPSSMKVWVKRRLYAFLLLSYVLLHVKQSYESSEEEREDGEALLVTWHPRVDALSGKQWRRKKRRRNRLMAASRTRDTITTCTARCGLRCVASFVFVRLVKAGDVELNPGPRDKRGESGLHVWGAVCVKIQNRRHLQKRMVST